MGEPYDSDDPPCRECGDFGEVLMYFIENALYYDQPAYEIVEMHPCPYCTRKL